MIESEELRKARVKLVNTSAAIIFICAAGLDFKKMSVLGASGGVQNTWVVYLGLILVIIYLLWRFIIESNELREYLDTDPLFEFLNRNTKEYRDFIFQAQNFPKDIFKKEVLSRKFKTENAYFRFDKQIVNSEVKINLRTKQEGASNFGRSEIIEVTNQSIQNFLKESKVNHKLTTSKFSKGQFTLAIGILAIIASLIRLILI